MSLYSCIRKDYLRTIVSKKRKIIAHFPDYPNRQLHEKETFAKSE